MGTLTEVLVLQGTTCVRNTQAAPSVLDHWQSITAPMEGHTCVLFKRRQSVHKTWGRTMCIPMSCFCFIRSKQNAQGTANHEGFIREECIPGTKNTV